MRKMLNKKSGFTLIELMIVVAILGILAAIAIPAFVTYVRRAKSAEATDQVKKMFNAASAYYNSPNAAQGLAGTQRVHCTVATATDGKTPSDQKVEGTYTDASFDSTTGIGFNVGYAYYSYNIQSGGAACNNSINDSGLYTFRALGDLDNDGTLSTFDLAAGSNEDNELYHARGFHITNETE